MFCNSDSWDSAICRSPEPRSPPVDRVPRYLSYYLPAAPELKTERLVRPSQVFCLHRPESEWKMRSPNFDVRSEPMVA